MRLFLTVLMLLAIQLLLEALGMAVLIKLGVNYLLDIGAPNDSFVETFFAMLVYVGFSKLIYLGLPYVVIMIVLHHYMNKTSVINYRLLAIMNPFVNLGLFIPVWLYFREVNYLLNPIIGTLVASVIIYLISSRFSKR